MNQLQVWMFWQEKMCIRDSRDYRDVVIHIFDEENRLFYDLERIWRDGEIVEREELN